MYQVQQVCKCGEKYWPTQRWIHEHCGVVAPTLTTNASNATWLTSVANAKKPSYRYRDPEKRKAYMRDLMRKRRAA